LGLGLPQPYQPPGLASKRHRQLIPARLAMLGILAQIGIGGLGRISATVGAVERGQVELVDHVKDEPGEVAFGQPVAQVRG
jgi:hypothetical protein